jgi:hypothetical protein
LALGQIGAPAFPVLFAPGIRRKPLLLGIQISFFGHLAAILPVLFSIPCPGHAIIDSGRSQIIVGKQPPAEKYETDRTGSISL